MDRRPLGASTGLEVSPIGLGTVKLGRTEGLKHPGEIRLPTDEEARALLDRAHSLGVNLLDTAPAYGVSEERLGGLLAGQRDRWVICTKAGEEFENGRSHFDFSPAAIRRSVERSLKRLRTDMVDVALLHSNGRDEWIIRESGAMEELERLRTEGKTRAIGVSTKTPQGALLAIERSDVLMATLNPSHVDDAEAIEAAGAAGVGVLIKKALASGHLDQLEAAGDPIEAAMRFVFTRPGVSSVVVGTTNPEHLTHNAAAAEKAIRRIRA